MYDDFNTLCAAQDARSLLAVGESVIKCQCSSERVQQQLWSYVSLSTFSGNLYLMTDSPSARSLVHAIVAARCWECPR